jgi:hypothetical protein
MIIRLFQKLLPSSQSWIPTQSASPHLYSSSIFSSWGHLGTLGFTGFYRIFFVLFSQFPDETEKNAISMRRTIIF